MYKKPLKLISLLYLIILALLPLNVTNAMKLALPCDCDGSCTNEGNKKRELFTGLSNPVKIQKIIQKLKLDSKVDISFHSDTLGTSFGEAEQVAFGSNKVELNSLQSDLGLPNGISNYQIENINSDIDLKDWHKKSEWFNSTPKRPIIYPSGDRQVIEPILVTGSNSADIRKLKDPSNIIKCKKNVERTNNSIGFVCNQIVKKICGKGCNHKKLLKQLNDANLDTIKSIVEYDTKCLTHNNRNNANFNHDYINARSGALFINLKKATNTCLSNKELNSLTKANNVDELLHFCSAVIVKPDYILTARHCFVNKDNDWRITKSCLDSGAIEFRSYKYPKEKYEIELLSPKYDRHIKSINNKSPKDDFIYLKTMSSIANISNNTRHILPTKDSPVVIKGYHELVLPIKNENWPVWRKKVRWTKPHCSFIRVHGNCAVTNCQTARGYSGAPLWTLDKSSETVLAGIQTQGGTNSFDRCILDSGSTDYVKKDGNLAIFTFLNSN